jgi:hypothetical protein
MSNDFKTEYLLEADEYEDQPREPRRPTPDDEQFSVDSYDADEMNAPTPDDGFSENAYADEPSSDNMSDVGEPETSDSADTTEIFNTVSEFFPGVDEDQVRNWIDHVVEKENVTATEDFLDSFEDAKSMEDSFETFKSGDSDKETPEDTDEKPENDDADEKPETPEDADGETPEDKKDEPIEESKKPSMSEFIEYLDDSAPSGEDEWIIGGKLRSDYMAKGAYGKALQKYDPIAFRVEYNDWIRDHKVDESKKPIPRKRVTESYDKKISEDLQLITTLRNAASASNDAELAKKYADVIEHLKTKLREPAQTVDSHKPAPKIQESIRQRIKARLKR